MKTQSTSNPAVYIGNAARAGISLLAWTFFCAPIDARAWEVADDFQDIAGFNTRSVAVQTDPSKEILYAAGWSAFDAVGSQAAVIRANFGQGWVTLDQWEPAVHEGVSWPSADYKSICHAPNGSLFASGMVNDMQGNLSTICWFVRRNTDGGTGWETCDFVDSGPGGKAQCRDVKAAPTGEIYAAGLTGTNQGHGGWVWLVRKSSDNGETWTTVDSVWSGEVKQAHAVTFHPSGTVFVVGTLGQVWTVRRSSDAGTTWTTVDSYSMGGQGADATCAAVDGSGRIYVAGQVVGRNKGFFTDFWVVRRSDNGGASWSVVDSVALGNVNQSRHPQSGPTGITITPSGGIIVCGYAIANNGTLRWIVRQGAVNAKGAVSWTNIDDYQPVAGQSARANGVVTDANGRIYVAGRAADPFGSDHWLIRRSP